MAKIKIKCGKCKKVGHPKIVSDVLHQCSKCNCINVIESNKKHTLKEWLNFNYLEYLGAILNVIDNHSFDEIKATTQSEIKAGKFTDIEVERLRGVLDQGFREGRTIQEIATDINNKVKPRDLFRVKDGEMQFNVDGKPILRLGKESRGIMLSRTETTRMAGLGALEHFKVQGVVEYTWVASLGSRTCPICLNLDGQVFEIGKGPVPGDPHPYCRCTVINLID